MKDIDVMLKLKSFKVLYVENDPFQMEKTLTVLSMFFQNITTSEDGLEALNIFKKEKFDLIICDVILPYLSGIEFAQEVRQLDKKIDFIFISSSTDISDLRKIIQIQALDFLTKPFLFVDLQNVLLTFGRKKIETMANNNLIDITDNIQFDMVNHYLIENNIKIELTFKEQQLLQLAVKNKGNVVSYEQIKKSLNYKEINKNLIKNVILRLRKKLSSDLFVNIKGVGYRVI